MRLVTNNELIQIYRLFMIIRTPQKLSSALRSSTGKLRMVPLIFILIMVSMVSQQEHRKDFINQTSLQSRDLKNQLKDDKEIGEQSLALAPSDYFYQSRIEIMRSMQSCPSMTFQESYNSTYGSTQFQIVPSLTLSCFSKFYSIQLATIGDAGVPSMGKQPIPGIERSFTFVGGSNLIRVNDWSKFADNSYYNITLTLVVSDSTGSSVTLFDSFFLIVGSVNVIIIASCLISLSLQIAYKPIAVRTYFYNEIISLDYSSAFDPYQADSGKLTAQWTCGAWFQNCANLKLAGNRLDPVTLITSHRIVFDQYYELSVLLRNPNIRNMKQVSDYTGIEVSQPQLHGPPLACLDFKLVFRNTALGFNRVTQNEREFLFDNLNYTDIVITGPQLSTTLCASLYGPNISALAFTSFNNPDLFDDKRSYLFNSTSIKISKTKISNALLTSTTSNLTSYAYLQNTQTKEIIGYQFVRVVLRLSDQTLYARTVQSFQQVDADKILYIDGGASYDLKSPQSTPELNYIWSIEGQPRLSFPNSKVLTLAPDQRIQYNINQAGRYYTFILIVSDKTRTSQQIKVTVQISPSSDPAKCVTVSLKDIDVTKIIAYTTLPLLLQASVTRSTSCTGLINGPLIWSCKDVSYQFWQLILNNNTIGMDRTDIQALPKSKDISMTVTQYYVRDGIEYTAVLNFVLFVNTADLVPVVNYPFVHSPREQRFLILDANNSYDPTATAQGTTDIPIQCLWTCPTQLVEVCNTAQVTSCILNISSSSILSSPNYIYQLSGNMHLFQLQITKDSRMYRGNYYVTIVDSNKYPKCTITVNSPFQRSINMHTNFSSQCNAPAGIGSPARFTYQWVIYQWDNQQYIQELTQLVTDNPYIRVPPYIMEQYRELIIQVMVTSDIISTTPVGIYYKANDQSYFKSGSVSLNFNQFVSYLSNMVLTPYNWESTLSKSLFFQYRIQESENNFRLLLAPQEASTINPIQTILPPLTYEYAVYIDVIDTLGNYVTIRQPIISQVSQQMTATQFALRVNQIIQTVNYQFTELDLEENIYKLRQYFVAYMQNELNTESMPVSFFKILSESTILYLYNTFYIDKRLSSVLSYDRRVLINQHVIEILHAITQKHRNFLLTNQIQQALIVVSQVVSNGNYSFSDQIGEINSKVFQIAINTIDVATNFMIDTTGNVYEQLLTKALSQLQDYLYPGEQLEDSSQGFFLKVTKLTSQSSSLLSNSTNFQYDRNEVIRYVSNPSGGALMVLARNDTYALVQIYDSGLNQIGVSRLNNPVKITFKMNEDQRFRYVNGGSNIRCASRDKFSDSWTSSRISQPQVNNQTGDVLCNATHFTQYTLFIVEKAYPVPVTPPTPTPPATPTPPQPPSPPATPIPPPSSTEPVVIIDPTKITNKTVNDTEVVGTWNSTLSPNKTIVVIPVMNNGLIFEEQSRVMYLVALFTLVTFVLMHLYFKCSYKSEHKDMPLIDAKHRFKYDYKGTLSSNRLRLFRKIFQIFSPYPNLFTVYNKYLHRWLRNLLVQIYFMTISLSFAVNSALLSAGKDNSEFATAGTKCAMFFIIMLGVIILRPLAIKAMYWMLYEPNGRVEDYRTGSNITEVHQKQDNRGGGMILDISDSQPNSVAIGKAESVEQLDSCQDREKEKEEELKKYESATNFQSVNGLERGNSFGMVKANFLPPIFDQNNGPQVIRQSFNFQNYESKQKSLVRPGTGSSSVHNTTSQSYIEPVDKYKHFKEMANAFDEIIIEEDSPNKKVNVVIAEEAELERSDRSIEIVKEPEREEIKFSTQHNKKSKFVKKAFNRKKQEQTEVKQSMDSRLPSILPSIGGRNLNIQPIQFELNPYHDNTNHTELFQGHQEFQLVNLSSGEKQRRRSSKRTMGGIQFYQQNQDENNDTINNDEEQQMEGGDNESDAKLESIENEDRREVAMIGSFYPEQTDNACRTDAKTKIGIDNIYEETIQIQDAKATPQTNKLYVCKIFGKTILVGIWCGLVLANLICLIKMRYSFFNDWAILSVCEFLALMFIIDPLLYLILAQLMIKQGDKQELQTKRDTNDDVIEYYTEEINKGGRCAKLYVDMFIGKEKMKDLRRKLNPFNPI